MSSIISILYGIDINNTIDLTEKLCRNYITGGGNGNCNKLIIPHKLNLNSVIGDPSPGTLKHIYVFYNINGQFFAKAYPENRVADIILDLENKLPSPPPPPQINTKKNIYLLKISEETNVNELYTENVLNPLHKNKIFEKINESWNKTKQSAKYWQTNSKYWNTSRFENYYYFVEDAIRNKKITIINPYTNEEITSDTYFLTTEPTICGFSNLICNYVFPNENLILGISLGTAMHSMFAEIIYLISIDDGDLFFLKYSFVNYDNLTKREYLDVLCRQLNKYKVGDAGDVGDVGHSTVKTIYGFHSAIGHTLCNDYTGLNILSHDNGILLSNIDEMIIGPNDPYFIADYYKKFNTDIVITKLAENNSINLQCGKGVFFKYNHFYVTENIVNKLKKELYIYRNPAFDADINRIRNNYSPVFIINLRCGTNSMVNQTNIMSGVINLLHTKYENAFFLLEGFCGFKKEENENPAITANGDKYNDILEMYNTATADIISKINTKNVKSLMNLHLPNIIKYTELADYGIYQNNTYVISTWICRVPGLYFGRPYTEHQKNIDAVSCENGVDVNYLNDKNKIIFIGDNTERTTDGNGVIIDRKYIISAAAIVDEVLKSWIFVRL